MGTTIWGVEFRVYGTWGSYRVYRVPCRGLFYRDIGNMETTIAYWGYIGIMENRMEPTIQGLIRVHARKRSAPNCFHYRLLRLRSHQSFPSTAKV